MKLGVHAPNFASLASPADVPVLLGNVARDRPSGPDGYDVVITGTDSGECAAWRKAGATWSVLGGE